MGIWHFTHSILQGSILKYLDLCYNTEYKTMNFMLQGIYEICKDMQNFQWV